MISTLTNSVVGLDTLVPTRRGKLPYTNLDNAASTPAHKEVLQTVNDFMPWYSSVHRGNGLKSRVSTELYEAARQTVGEFVGADAADHVVMFGKNTTEAINKLSYRLGLRKKDIVLVSHLEHHSNDLPWRARATVRRIGMTTDGGVDIVDYLALLAKYAGRVKLVALSGASNVTGYMPNIHWFARQAHQAGAHILIDGAQLGGHRRIAMKRLDDPEHLDFVTLSGHKMYAPFGCGALIGRRDVFTRGEPEYRGGGTVAMVTTKTIDWALPPDSDEAGSPNVVGAVAMAKAIQVLERLGLDIIQQHEADLTSYALDSLAAVPGLTIYGSDSTDAKDRVGVIPFNLRHVPPHLVSAILGFEWGIGVRSGCFCAHPYVMSLLGIDSIQQKRVRHNVLHHRQDLVPGMVRISLGMYNTQEDIDWLVEALIMIQQGLHGEYQVDARTGHYTPSKPVYHAQQYFTL